MSSPGGAAPSETPPPSRPSPTGGPEHDIVVTLRDGSEHMLVLDTLGRAGDAAHILSEISAGRSQLLRGWVAVHAPPGAAQAVVKGEEIMQLRLVERSIAPALAEGRAVPGF